MIRSLRTGTTPDKRCADRPFAGGQCVAAILLINGIMLPLYYRFGAEKARMLYMLMFAGMGAALGGGTVLMDAVPEPDAAIAIVGVLAAVLVLYALSWRVSVAWYGKYKK